MGLSYAAPEAKSTQRIENICFWKRMWPIRAVGFSVGYGGCSGTYLARAFLNPARTLSAINERSSSAMAPRTRNTIFPVGVEVSNCSFRLTNSIPRALKVSSARSRWETEQAKRAGPRLPPLPR